MRPEKNLPHLAKYIAVASLAAAIFLSLVPTSFAGSFGSSPPFLNADHLVPGSSYSETIYLVQDQPNVDLEIRAVLSVPDAIRSWFAIDKGFDFIIPKGTRQFPVVVSVNIPKGTGLGKYSGNLVFTTVPGKTGQVSIALGANIAVNLTVGIGIFEKYTIPLIIFPDIEEGWSPRATVKFQNDGNIPEGFDSATFDIYDQYNSARLAYITKQDGFPETPPFSVKEYTIEFPTDFHLGIGDYWGSVAFYNKDHQVIASQKTIFHVLPAGSLSPFGKLTASFKTYWFYYLIALVALIVIEEKIRKTARRQKAA